METLIYQSQKKSCGYACVKMALVHFGHNRRFANIKEPSADEEGPTLTELISFARPFGLELGAFEITDFSQLKDFRDYPILAVLLENGVRHMVYVRDYYLGHFHIYDPARGRRNLSFKQFSAVFTGVFLMEKDLHIVRCKAKKPRVIPPFFSIIQIALVVLSGLLLSLGLYYVDREVGNYLSPVLLFSAFALTMIASRAFMVICLKKFDEKYVAAVDEVPLSRRRDNYEHYTRYKTAIFSSSPEIFATSITVVCFSLLFALNDLWMGLGILIVFAISAIEWVLIRPWLEKRKDKLETLENGFLGGPWEKETRRPKALEVTSMAYKIANFLSYRQYLWVFLYLMASLMAALLSKNVSLNYLIFVFMGLLFLGSQFQKLLSCIQKHDVLLKEESYFIHHFVAFPSA